MEEIAEAAGEQMCPNTSGTKLLKAAELSAALHAQVLSTIAGTKKTDSSRTCRRTKR